jgi:uncharacterized protein (TIGR04222 family)
MKSEQLELLKRLEACTLDDAAAAFPFSERLARDNHWSLVFAQRVIREYKRFAFLAVAAGHPVSPSHAVDQAWHLHLLYTQSYWKDFCGEVLRTSLHHQPTRGGELERGKFEDWYANTLASYRRFFGEKPPVDIWPERNEHPIQVHFNPETHWLMPKPRTMVRAWRYWVLQKLDLPHPRPVPNERERGVCARLIESTRRVSGDVERGQTLCESSHIIRAPSPWGEGWGEGGSKRLPQFTGSSLATALPRGFREFLRICFGRPGIALGLMIIALLVAGCGPGMTGMTSPFDFKGPEFLGFYLASFAIACAAAAVLRWHLRQPAGIVGGEPPPLDPYAVTYLSGGRDLAISAALTNLCQRGVINVSSLFGRLAAVNPLPSDAHAFERGIYDLVARCSDTVKAVREKGENLTTVIAESLKEQGLVVSDAQARRTMVAPLLLAAVVPIMGLIKILVGLERDRPVGFLVAACIVSLIVIAAGFARRPLRTRRGDAVLAALRSRHEGLRETARTSFSNLSDAALPLAIGLFGMSVLAGTPLDDLRNNLQPTASGSSCGSGCGGSSCGGGGDGGGGCGGCGGGD